MVLALKRQKLAVATDGAGQSPAARGLGTGAAQVGDGVDALQRAGHKVQAPADRLRHRADQALPDALDKPCPFIYHAINGENYDALWLDCQLSWRTGRGAATPDDTQAPITGGVLR